MAMAKGLGKGLDALMGDSATMQNQEAGSVTLPISQVEPGLNQPRKWFDEDALARVEVFPLEVFDQAQLQHLPVVRLDDDHRHLPAAGQLGGPPAALRGGQGQL